MKRTLYFRQCMSRERMLTNSSNANCPRLTTARVSHKQDRLLRAIELGESLSAEDLAFSGTNWGDIKFDKVASKPFHAAARADKARAVKEAEEAAFREAQGAPDRGVFRAPSDGPGAFRVNASVSEVPGDFRMRLDDGPGAAGKRKPSRTFVQVLEKGVYRGKPVTKVLFRSVLAP